MKDKIRAEKARKVLPELVARRLYQLRSVRNAVSIDWDAPVTELVPQLNFGKLETPYHLAPYADKLDEAIRRLTDGSREGIRCVIAAPPQHGKTELTKAALIKAFQVTAKRHAYVTYNQERSDSVAKWTKMLALEAGVEVGGVMRGWSKPNRAEVKWSSIGGLLTGQPIDGILFVDDPIKDAEEARSKLKREHAEEWMRKVALSRLHPGASVILMATRWHEDDLSGRFIKKDGWEYVNLQAIADGQADSMGRVIGDPLGRRLGEALWPAHRPAEFLAEFRKNLHTWHALYQGQPRPVGAEVFKTNPARFEALPNESYRCGHGVDLAYTSKTSSDYSVCVTGRKYGSRIYVTGVIRRQVAATEFALSLKAAQSNNRGPMVWHAAGSEKGTAQFITQKIEQFRMVPATTDKFTRAQPAAELWNADQIVLPGERSEFYGPWVDDFIDEVTSFSGQNDPHDDQVDALGSLVEALKSGDVKFELGMRSAWAGSRFEDDDDDD